MNAPEQPPETVETAEDQAVKTVGFIGRVRQAVKREAKFTFTLPKPGEGLMLDLMLKVGGASAAGLFAKVGLDQLSNPLLAPGERPTTMAAAEGIALAGLASVALANRVRASHQSNTSED